jgi:hypothetical protein
VAVDSDPCAVCLERQCTVAAEGLSSPLSCEQRLIVRSEVQDGPCMA